MNCLQILQSCFAFGSSYIYGAYRALQSGDPAPTFTIGSGLKEVAGLTVFRNATLDGTPGFTRETVNQAAHPAPAVTTTGTNELVIYMFGEKSSTNTGWSDPAEPHASCSNSPPAPVQFPA